jgi:DNA-binding transcriptional regulator YdaS (Cro superfamily)
METALDIAKKKASGPSGLAKAIGGLTPQAVSQWRQVPATRVLDVERVTGVPRHQLRPDIYPAPVGVENQGVGDRYAEASRPTQSSEVAE